MTLLSKILQASTSPAKFIFFISVFLIIFVVISLIFLYKVRFSFEKFLSELGVPKIIAIAVIALILSLLFQVVTGYIEESIHESIEEKTDVSEDESDLQRPSPAFTLPPKESAVLEKYLYL